MCYLLAHGGCSEPGVESEPLSVETRLKCTAPRPMLWSHSKIYMVKKLAMTGLIVKILRSMRTSFTHWTLTMEQ